MLGDRVRMQAHAGRRGRVHPQHGDARPSRRPRARDRRRRARARRRRQGRRHHRDGRRRPGRGRHRPHRRRLDRRRWCPGTGDEVQALKAGIMEIADIFVVNKADREGADRLVAAVESNLALHDVRRAGRVAAADRQDGGDDAAGRAGAGRRDRAVPRARARARRRARRRTRSRVPRCASSVAAVHGSSRARRARARRARRRSSTRIAAREIDPYTAADDLLARGAASDPDDAEVA